MPFLVPFFETFVVGFELVADMLILKNLVNGVLAGFPILEMKMGFTKAISAAIFCFGEQKVSAETLSVRGGEGDQVEWEIRRVFMLEVVESNLIQ